jgi:hypothetical protein
LSVAAGALVFFAQAQPVAHATLAPAGRPATLEDTRVTPAHPSTASPTTVPAQSSGAITITSNKFSGTFPTDLEFELDASNAPILQIALYVAVDGMSSSTRLVPDFTAAANVQAKYDWNLSRSYLPPGVTGAYWWTVHDQTGRQLQTAKVPFRVDDPAHDWNKLSNDKLALTPTAFPTFSLSTGTTPAPGK